MNILETVNLAMQRTGDQQTPAGLRQLADDCDHEDRLDLSECAWSLRWAALEIERLQKVIDAKS